jgi:CheY-like chemotaxis protein
MPKDRARTADQSAVTSVTVTIGPTSVASARVWAAAARATITTVKERPDLGVPDDVADAFEGYLAVFETQMEGDVFLWTGAVDATMLRHLAAHWARLVNLARDETESALLPADPAGAEFYDALATGFALGLAAADDVERFAPKFEEVVPEFDSTGRSPAGGVDGKDTMEVLLVDDNDDIRLLLRIGLESTGGFHVAGEARDGQEAVDLVRGGLRPDAILLDLTMPVMDGLTALPLLREASPSSRVVVFSANDARQSRDQVLAMGASAFLRKDAGISDLVATLRER